MASCPSRTDEAGYATPAALVLSLALALVASAFVVRSVMALRLARADFTRFQAVQALDGAHLMAAAAIIRSGRLGPYHWTFTTDGGWMEARAELEADKLDLATASGLEDRVFAAFGVADPGALKARLSEAAGDPRLATVAGLDAAPLWRACARRMISPLGRSAAFAFAGTAEPGPGPKPTSWRIGEEWRMEITTKAGWRDERIVRFTGDARHPVAVVRRWWSRGEGDGGECDAVLREISAA